MSDTFKIQIPLDKTLKVKGTKKAKELGYTSLQEVLRVFITSFVEGKIIPTFESRERLSPRAEKRYDKMIKEHEKDRKAGKVKSFKTSSEAIKYLNSDD